VNTPSSRSLRNYRLGVLALLLAASFLNYFDRQTVSILKTTLKRTYGINDAGYAFLLNLFTGCYAVAYLASGWVVDRIGPKKALPLFVGFWSAVTAGCGLARSFGQLAAMRALLGVAEPGFQPVSVRVGAIWAPPQRQGFFLSLCGAGSILGAIAAPPLIAFIALRWSWRYAFILPAILGLGIAAIWAIWYRDPPTEAKAESGSDPTSRSFLWKELWSQPALWGLILSRVLGDPVWYYCLFWLPGYLQEAKGASLSQLGRLGWIPFLVGNIAGIGLTAWSDRLARRSANRIRARLRLLCLLSGIGGLFLLLPGAGPHGSVLIFCGVMVLACGWMYSLPAIIAEVFPLGNIASVWSIVGSLGAVAVVGFNWLVGQTDQTKGFPPTFIVMALLYPIGALLLCRLVRSKLHPVDHAL
jgi:ACS family hexuronate transporter-like MFS transporter